MNFFIETILENICRFIDIFKVALIIFTQIFLHCALYTIHPYLILKFGSDRAPGSSKVVHSTAGSREFGKTDDSPSDKETGEARGHGHCQMTADGRLNGQTTTTDSRSMTGPMTARDQTLTADSMTAGSLTLTNQLREDSLSLTVSTGCGRFRMTKLISETRAYSHPMRNEADFTHPARKV